MHGSAVQDCPSPPPYFQTGERLPLWIEAPVVLAVGRRDLLWMLAALLAARPGKARAQPADLPTIGFLSTRSRDESKELSAAFRAGLKAEGFAEGENVAIKYRWAEFVYDRLAPLDPN